MNKKTYLITGGAGFIGSWVSEQLLNQGHKVIVIDNFNNYYSPEIKEQNISSFLSNPNYDLHRVDIRNRIQLDAIFSGSAIDGVIHLAAMAGVRPSIADPLLYESVNMQGTINLLECMRVNQVRKLVFASSSSIYGDTPKIPFREDSLIGQTLSPYAATKKAGEEMCRLFHSLYGIDVAMLRFFTVYGPRQRPDLAIHKFTRMIMNEEPIPFYGDGSTVRDYAFIDDVLDGIIRSIHFLEDNNGVCESFNLSGDHPVSLREMVDTISVCTGKKPAIWNLPLQPGDMKTTSADISKARRLLGYNPCTSFQEGIRKFVDWYSQYIENRNYLLYECK